MGDELSQSNYQTVELGDLGRIVTGKTPSTKVPEYFGGDIPFVTPSDMDGRKTISSTDRYLTQDGASAVKSAIVPEGSVMVSCIGSDLGKVAFTGKTSVTNQQINTIIVDRYRFNAEYIYYDLSTRQNELKTQGASGSAVPILNKGHFSKLHLKLPPLDIQATIANILSAFDDKIELNRQMNRTLEAMARAIFKAWFVDFEPVKAKAAGATSFRGMPQDVFDQLPARLTDSELGPVPEGWEIKAVSAIADYVNGKAFTKHANGRGRMIIRIAELNSGPGGATKYSDIEADPQYTAFLGDILFAWSGSLNVYRWHLDEAIINQHIFKVIPKGWPKWYVYYRLVEVMPFFQSIASTKATTMGHIKRGHLDDAKFANPPEWLVEAADEQIRPLYELVHCQERQSQTLSAIRDALLPKLISGEIRVPEALESADGR